MKNRLISLDVLRGLTIMLMTVVNNPGDWGNVFPPFLHAEWHGCTPTDLVFPTFLLIVGISAVLAMPTRKNTPEVRQKILIRTLRIFTLGWFLFFFSKIHIGSLEGLPLLGVRLLITAVVSAALFTEYDRKKQLYVVSGIFLGMIVLAFGGFEDYSTVRIPGVLQRIAVVYAVISFLYLNTTPRTQAIIAAGLLLLYWGLMTLVPVPGFGPANLEKGTNLAGWVDNLLLPGHLWASAKTWDPEGILSTLPAIATGIAGLLTGWLLQRPVPAQAKAVNLLLAGAGGIIAGWLWGQVFPINKSLWTSSYVLYAAGWGVVSLAVLYYLIDVKGWKAWTKPFVMFGVNPMIVFFFSGIVPRVLTAIKVGDPADPSKEISLQSFLYKHQLAPLFADPRAASLSWALLYLLFWFGVVYVLYRRGVVVKV
ncbi:acyltransferase family protein [Siphonobacter aquaeclarae]|uniref:Predicted acyltransferase n=1 Tax=Siphonobacter aquaeclarae TaxID=563176 RepID=A0A1G9KYT9_9BACT|nr:heparan-alpha-glucosaminide N-acetyltransferase domain-containing protein [Siphonobacter aquaeclarae]SDL54724.1 Predicted acyltransferase [Siphonobacter aquaeclarae]